MMNREQVYKSRYLAGQVVRYHTWPTLRKPTVAEHCWRVACIYVELFGMPRAEVFYFILHHDSGEMWVGDVPFTAKDKTVGLREAMNIGEAKGRAVLGIELPDLTADEYRKVKICDLLEMYEFGKHEFRLGNLYAKPVVEDTYNAAAKLATLDEQRSILKWRADND